MRQIVSPLENVVSKSWNPKKGFQRSLTPNINSNDSFQ